MGCGFTQILTPFVMFSAIVSTLMYCTSIWFLPYTYRLFTNLEEYAQNNYALVFLEPGVFTSRGDQFTIYVDSKDLETNSLNKIFVYDTSTRGSEIFIAAESGYLGRREEDVSLILHNGSYLQGNKKSGKTSLLFFDHYEIALSGLGDKIKQKIRSIDSIERSISDLLHPNEPNEIKRVKLIVQGHQRLIWPMYPTLLVLILVSIYYRYTQNRRLITRSTIADYSTLIVPFMIVVLNFAIQAMAFKNYYFIFLLYANVLVALAGALVPFYYSCIFNENNP